MVGLVGYVAKGIKARGVHLDPEIAMAVAIPVVVIVVWMLLHRVRRKLGAH